MLRVRRKNKVIVGAWVNRPIVEAIEKWLERHPASNRSVFLTIAVAEKLRRETTATLTIEDEPENQKAGSVQAVSKRSVKTEAGVRRGRGKIHLNAWLDSGIVRVINVWVKSHPGMNRSAFLIAAVAEKLRAEKLPIPAEAVIPRSPKMEEDYRDVLLRMQNWIASANEVMKDPPLSQNDRERAMKTLAEICEYRDKLAVAMEKTDRLLAQFEPLRRKELALRKVLQRRRD